MTKLISVIIPARNEEVLLGDTLHSVLRAAGVLESRALESLDESTVELLVVDNGSTDGTAAVLESFGSRGVVSLRCDRLKAPCARNAGARRARGQILCFLDADTLMPPEGLCRVREHWARGYQAGLFRLAARDGGLRAACWWTFWEHVRRLPLPRAKSLPAFMFCSREAFERYGPFDEEVALGEEWPILAGLYAQEPDRFIYDRSTTALSSSRRMELQRLGYLREFLKYLWAVLDLEGRRTYSDRLRHEVAPPAAPGLAARWGRMLAGVRFHRLSPVGDRVRKVRKGWAAPAIAVLNPALRWTAGVEILDPDRWYRREQEIHRALYGQWVEPVPGGVLLPRYPGESPLEHPGSLIPAVAELHRLHSLGRSHGDATAANCRFDPQTGRVWWLDYDTGHCPDRPMPWRRADDLRALICSAAARLPEARWGALAEAAASYPSQEVRRQFLDELRRGDPYALGQAPMGGRQRRSLEAFLQERLRPSSPWG